MARSRDLVDAALVAAPAVALLLVTRQFETAPGLLTQGVSPAFFPRLLLAALLLLALLLPLEGRRSSSAKRRGGFAVPRTTLSAGVVLLAAVLLLPRLGTFPVLALAAPCLAMLWGERRPWRLVGLAILLPGVLDLLFSDLLGVHFQRGAWWGGG